MFQIKRTIAIMYALENLQASSTPNKYEFLLLNIIE